MCQHGETVSVRVLIPADLSRTGKEYWKDVQIDMCIAPIVRALSEAGVHMRASCCGHGGRPGYITLADGRELVIWERYRDNGFITPEEHKITSLLGEAFCTLRDECQPTHPSHLQDMADAVHKGQYVIAARVAQRAAPEVFATYQGEEGDHEDHDPFARDGQ